MDAEEYDNIVRFLESKDGKQRTWPQSCGIVQGQGGKKGDHQRCESFSPQAGLLFQIKRCKKKWSVVSRMNGIEW